MDRFWSKVQKGEPDECWEWQAYSPNGRYGRFRFGKRPAALAHRVAYELTHGEIPEGQVVMHTCDNPLCCNPDHLRVGSQADNLQDMRSKERHRYENKLSFEDRKTLRHLYYAEQCTLSELTRHFGVGYATVKFHLKQGAYSHGN